MKKSFKNRLILRSTSGLQFVLKAELVYLKANGSYTDYYVLKNGNLSCITQVGHLALHEEKLDNRFWRISQSCMVNLDFVERICNDRTLQLTIPIPELLAMSVRYWKVIKKHR